MNSKEMKHFVQHCMKKEVEGRVQHTSVAIVHIGTNDIKWDGNECIGMENIEGLCRNIMDIGEELRSQLGENLKLMWSPILPIEDSFQQGVNDRILGINKAIVEKIKCAGWGW